eukprot:Blabericola_migrator_1__4385@NODE_2354_length_2893_cov_93_623850_g1473_i0_p1_GENE_NODE_2354_length_2893_cov_93_623850_g1473_i0NODE_2354_length_2893_cov_93_623850_g1473_i0_p1_ORF_typecomplete_len794_score85_03IRK_C/PF17655_1/2_9e20IRK/PF01007_20/3_3e13Ion_trans_2/PF07885_16/0_3_NODE_2354_length_2893_cov_93_623850_g1473_i03552736
MDPGCLRIATHLRATTIKMVTSIQDPLKRRLLSETFDEEFNQPDILDGHHGGVRQDSGNRRRRRRKHDGRTPPSAPDLFGLCRQGFIERRRSVRRRSELFGGQSSTGSSSSARRRRLNPGKGNARWISMKSDKSNVEESSYSASSDSRGERQNSRKRAAVHHVPVLGISDGASPGYDGSTTASRNQNKVPHNGTMRLALNGFTRGLSFAEFDRGGLPGYSGVRAFSIQHKWLTFSHQFDFWFRDRFHMLLSLSFKSLVVFLMCAEATWAIGLALLLAVLTQGDVEGCLGGEVSHWIHYYFFTVETMFTIGFGSPRHPACVAADVFVSIAVFLTNVLNGVFIGMVFAKFSSGTTRRWAMAFSPEMCGVLCGEVIAPDDTSEEFLPTSISPDDDCQNPRAMKKDELVLTPPELISNVARIDDYPLTQRRDNGVLPKTSNRLDHDHDERSIQTMSERHHEDHFSEELKSVAHSLQQSPRISTGSKRQRFASCFVSGTQPLKFYQHTYDATGITRSSFPPYERHECCSLPHDPLLSSVGLGSRLKSPGLMPRSYRRSLPGDRLTRFPASGRDHRALRTQSPVIEGCPVLPPVSTHQPQETICLNSFDCDSVSYSLSFRLMNLTNSSFFDPKLSIFLLYHDVHDLTITQILRHHTDIPLEFLEMPITVTIDSRDPDSPLHKIPVSELVLHGVQYELVVLLTFVDNQSSRTIELRKSWQLNSVVWGHGFRSIVRRDEKGRHGAYDVDVEALDAKCPLDDDLNVNFHHVVQEQAMRGHTRPVNAEDPLDVVIPVERSSLF